MKKIIIIITVLVITLFGGAILYIDQSINNSKLNELVVNAIEENLVGVKVSILDLNYDLGLSVSVNIKDLSVKDLETNLNIFSLKESHLEINIFSILTGGGKIDILIDNPVINISKNKNGELNLSKYIAKSNSTKEKKKNVSIKNNKNIEIPSFIENSKLNFKLSKLLVNYTDSKLSKFKVDKILLKDLNMKNPTAYEFDSFIDYSINKNDSISFESKFFGEIALDQLITKKELKVTSYLYIQNIKTNLVKNKISDIESKIEVSLNDTAELKLSVQTTIKNLLNSNISVSTKKEDVNISLKELSVDINKTLSFLELESVKVNESNLKINGDIKADLAFSKLVPNITVSLSNPLVIDSKEARLELNRLNLALKNKLLDLNINTSLFDGEIDLKTSTNIDLLNPPSSIQSLSRISSKLIIKDIIIPNKYFESKESDEQVTAVDTKVRINVKDNSESTLVPSSSSSILINNISLGSAKISGSSSITSGGYEVKSSKTNISIDKSKTDLSFNVNLKNGVNSKFRVKSSRLNFSSFKSFVPKELGELSGILNFDVKGSVTEKGYNVDGELLANDGSLKGLKLKEMISSFLGKLSKLLPKKEMNISENYDSLRSNFNASPSRIIIKSLKLVGKNKSLNLKLKGNVQQDSKESKLVGALSVKEYDKDVRRISHDNTIPLMLSGSGYALTPSMAYTTKNLVKNKAKKEVDKLKNTIEEKAKDLFKGFKL